MQLVAEYGFVYVFAVIMAGFVVWLMWKLAVKLVLGENSMAERALATHIDFVDTTKKTMNEVKEAVVEGKIIANSIDTTLSEHTAMLKQDTDSLRDLRSVADRIESKVNTIHCQV